MATTAVASAALDCTTGELRQANERCATIEIEVREEVSNEMADLMKEAEARLREMYTKAADVRVVLHIAVCCWAEF